VRFDGDFISSFHRAHEKCYGYLDRSRAYEIVNIRGHFTARTAKPAISKLPSGGTDSSPALLSKSPVQFRGRHTLAAIYDRAKLRAGNRLPGPAIVTEYSATTFIPPDWFARVDRIGNLLLEPRR
jgi:N-methylhydantoinase A